jgi:hypothetical protein
MTAKLLIYAGLGCLTAAVILAALIALGVLPW